ncbi:outer membrane beta-barrel protein [Pseudohongiella acticola]|jgi:OmpA-like transmembrane domain|uniref:outer membrane beta-barrel protein n=1 Tax=Pseudohongiella acticola TaxID=1524254 RepID=UPI0030EC30AC
MRFLPSLSILVLLLLPAVSHAQKNWFVELGYGETDIAGGGSAPMDILTFRSFGGSSCIVPAPFNPCLTNVTYAPVGVEGESVNKFGIGRRLWEFWSVELSYLDYADFNGERIDGSASGSFSSTHTSTMEVDGLNLSITGRIPLYWSFSLFGRVGIFDYASERVESIELRGGSFLPGITREELDWTVDPDGGPSMISTVSRSEGSELNYGLGLNYSINDTFDIQLEYQEFPDIGDADIEQVVVSVITRF